MKRLIHPMVIRGIALLGVCAIFSLLPARLAAQKIENCSCDLITVFSQKETPCVVELAFDTPDGIQIVRLEPGDNTQVACIPGTIVSLLDCRARRVPITPGGCSINVNGSGRQASCCVDACLVESASGCWTVFVRPTISMAPGCPCL